MQRNKLLYFAGLLMLSMFAGCMPLESLDDPEGETDPLTIAELLLKYRCAYYTFDNSMATDVSVTTDRYDGVLFGDPKFLDDSPSGAGKSLFLNGIKQQYVNIPYNVFAKMDYFTISFWIKDFSSGSIISGVSSSDRAEAQWPRLYMQDDGKILFYTKGDTYSGDNPPFAYNYTNIQSSGWHHIAVTCITDEKDPSICVLRLYIDGVLMDNVSARWKDPSVINKVQIGGNGNGVFPIWSSMKIDNVSIFYAALGDGVIKYIYDNKL